MPFRARFRQRLALVLCGTMTALAVPSVRAEDNVPTSYPAANASRQTLTEPPLPSLGPAGYRFLDPAFRMRLLRVTDGNTRPGTPGRSYSGPSAAHQLAWNATSDRFYVRGIDGSVIPYTFDASSMTAARIQPSSSGDGGLTISTQVEPQFSFLSPNVLFGSSQDPNTNSPVIRKFDFNTVTYTNIINLHTMPGGTVDANTFAGALSSSATSPEKLAVMFGGPRQDTHYKVAVFPATGETSSAVVLNTQASTINRNGVVAPTNITLGFYLHHVWMDQSGRYVLLYPVNATPAPYLVWDLNTDRITEVRSWAEGHDATGFESQVNQSCCTASRYDAAQWQWRSLASPTTTADLINPVLDPQEIYMADHTSWNNAQPGSLVPILSSTYRYYEGTFNTTPWRAWDNEIIAIQTASPGSGGIVWRFAHHRSNVEHDSNSQAVYFWYIPRAVISPDGRWALFTSNWEKTLGAVANPEAGGGFRTDVFVVALTERFTDRVLTGGLITIKAMHIHELRTYTDALRRRFGLSDFAWTDASLTGTVVRATHVRELRTAIEQAYAAAGRPIPSFTDPALTPGTTVIRAVHIQELRDAVTALEAS